MGRLRGFIWLSAGLFIAVLAGFVGFITLTRAEAQAIGEDVSQPTVSVVVAVSEIGVRSELQEGELAIKDVPVDAAPEGAVSRVEDAEGQVTLVDLYPGEVVLSQRLTDPNVAAANGRMALVLADDEVMMAFPAEDLMSKVGVLKAGDQVDLLFSLEVPVGETVTSGPEGTTSTTQDKLSTFNTLQNVTISAKIAGGAPAGTTGDENDALGQTTTGTTNGPNAILLTVSPQDALVLKYVKDAGGMLDIVLRAPGADQPFETEPVDADYLINRYQIPR